MKILKIAATKESIVLYADTDANVWVRESVSTVEKPRCLSMIPAAFTDGKLVLNRFESGRDRLFSAFTVFADGEPCEGVRFVTDIAGDVPEVTSDYPQPEIIKAGCRGALAAKLGIGQGLMNINLPCIMTVMPEKDDIAYAHNGRTYYFRRDEIEKIDASMRDMPMTTMILLNSPKLFGSHREKPLLDACLHPHYDSDYRDAYISAFDTETEEGLGYYGAFVEFLAERYAGTEHGHAVGAIVSNEVNSQYIWGNAGEMPMERYIREYAQALRTAWLCGQKHNRHFRVYISLDQFWCGVNFDPSQTGRYYSGRGMLEELSRLCAADGDFGWNVAYHPYPEDLRWPDFWHDRVPDFTFSTGKITFKNMEVLEAFLSQEGFLYRGAPRRILFSEQGFNSHSGELQGLTERMAKAGYVLAYLKARNMKTVDLFTHHALVDNPHEFGLNLGIFRYDPEKPDRLGEPKPIFEAFSAMDTPDEAAVVQWARSFIGAELFDYLLNPPIEYHDRDTSKDNEFG